MMAMDDQRVEAVLESFRGIFQNFRQMMASNWMHLDLSMAQMRVLFVLVHHGPDTVSVMAKRLGVGLPTASHLIERLVRQGLVTRVDDPADRRQVHVYLTAQGEELTGQFQQRVGALRSWLLRLSDRDLEMLYQGMQALARVMPPAEDSQTADRP